MLLFVPLSIKARKVKEKQKNDVPNDEWIEKQKKKKTEEKREGETAKEKLKRKGIRNKKQGEREKMEE